ncbi:hypothetical protein [Amycolatopsis samaneae]|uniref:LPXTG-motif cell wall anchor domain-containing protein n=1 Tax=Amycolatopsis samaneae TaxID=664691 RepID=A0ABW5GLD1_9PSEU
MAMNKTTRLLTGSAVAGFALLLGTATASASPEPDAVGQAATTPQATDFIAHFFVDADRHAAGQPSSMMSKAEENAAAAAKAPQIVGTPLTVNTLNPAFVTGGSSDVATFGYYAVHARSASGQDASVWLTRQGEGWEASNITTGTEEITYPAQAGGDTVFTEPQINAWYRVHEGRVVGLNDVAKRVVGPSGATLAEYQRTVHGKYADKMPGSDYVRKGRLGGFDQAPAVKPAEAQSPVSGGTATEWILGSGFAAVAGLAGVFVVRRRRAGRTH